MTMSGGILTFLTRRGTARHAPSGQEAIPV
jgi:hypothetical protein